MQKAAVHSRTITPERLPVFREIIQQLQANRVQPVLSGHLYNFLKENGEHLDTCPIFNTHQEILDCNLAISAGGDGTMLETVTYVRGSKIPILGSNTGRLGFLATTSRHEIGSALDAIFYGNYTLDIRTLIQVESDEDIFEGINFGLNEFTILKRDTSSMILVHTYVDGQKLNSYWADGLIIATPTGSTGYSLSVGGPVVMPQSQSFVISPVSPHNLNVRPLIVPDRSVLSFEIESRSKNFLVSLDSRSKKVVSGIRLSVKKCDFQINLIKLSHQSFLNTLQRKLNWGADPRN